MLIKLTVTTKQSTELTVWWTVTNTPTPWEVKYKAVQLAQSVGQHHRSHQATVVS